MNRKIRVLQSMDTIGVGGTEVFVMNLYRTIDRDAFDFDFVVYDDYKSEYLQEVLANGDKVYQFHRKHKNRLLNYFDQERYVKSILKKEKYDIVHCNGNSYFGILRAALPAHNNGVHVITHSHNQGEKHEKIIGKMGVAFLKRKVSSLAEMGFTCSDKAGESKYTKLFIQSNKYRIIDNGTDYDKYRFSNENRKRIRAEFGINEASLLIGHVGRFEYPKNQSYLFDIFDEVLKVEPTAKLILVGDGIQREEFEDKIDKLGIKENVILTGLRMDVNEIYSAMDVFVLPSIHEGFPFVLVEAQMNGLRCVVTENMSKDVNISGSVIFLQTNIAPFTWAETIIRSQGRLDRDQVQRVIDKYDIKKIAAEIENYYRDLVK